MITFSRLGRKGNLGNQMFQIASTMGIARANGQQVGFPAWKSSEHFKNPFPQLSQQKAFTEVEEKTFAFHDWPVANGDYDLNGWLQSEKYFEEIDVKKVFELNDDIVANVRERFRKVFEKGTILISVRRGDFVHHPYYFQISYVYYFKALTTFFPDWKQMNLVFTSDDISYCKHHFGFLENAVFPEGLTPFEQLALAQQCNHFVISNSTFSWWAAWLGEKPDSKVIRPPRNFRKSMSTTYNEKDFFPDRWISFSEKGKFVGFNNLPLFVKGESYALMVLLNYLKRRGIFLAKTGVKRVVGKT